MDHGHECVLLLDRGVMNGGIGLLHFLVIAPQLESWGFLPPPATQAI
jgi:hypothetical protein